MGEIVWNFLWVFFSPIGFIWHIKFENQKFSGLVLVCLIQSYPLKYALDTAVFHSTERPLPRIQMTKCFHLIWQGRPKISSIRHNGLVYNLQGQCNICKKTNTAYALHMYDILNISDFDQVFYAASIQPSLVWQYITVPICIPTKLVNQLVLRSATFIKYVYVW